MRTYVIGRSPHADIVLADPTVARRHAELLSTDDGRLFLTDCASDSGSWRQASHPPGKLPDAGAETGNSEWLPLRQTFINANEPLRLGDFHCNAAQLLQLANDTPDNGNARPRNQDSFGARNQPGAMPRGSVERDPRTGEIIRRRAQ